MAAIYAKLQPLCCLVIILYLFAALLTDIYDYRQIRGQIKTAAKMESEMKQVLFTRLNALIALLDKENIDPEKMAKLKTLNHNLQK